MSYDGSDPRRVLRHAVAQPLATILTETQLILLDADTLDPKLTESLRAIEGACFRIRDLLRAE